MSTPTASMMPEHASEGFELFPGPLRDRGRAHASFQLINQTVMTRAEVPTVDSWVHLAQTRRTPLWATLFVGLGEQSVIVRVPGRDAEISWTEIRRVTASQPAHAAEGSSKRDSTLYVIELHRDPAASPAAPVQRVGAEGYVVPGDALFTALRWYHAHPESRWELGRIDGERRLDGWRRDALRP